MNLFSNTKFKPNKPICWNITWNKIEINDDGTDFLYSCQKNNNVPEIVNHK